MIKELFLLPAVLGCSLGGSASSAVRHNAIDVDGNDYSFSIVVPYGTYLNRLGNPFVFSSTSVIGEDDGPTLEYDGNDLSLIADGNDSFGDNEGLYFYFTLESQYSLDFSLMGDLVFNPIFDGNGIVFVADYSACSFEGALVPSYDEESSIYRLSPPVPTPISHNGVAIVNEIVSVLVSGLTALGTGIGLGISNFAQALAFSNGQLSVYFILVVAFAAVALAVGLTSRLFQWLSSLGN